MALAVLAGSVQSSPSCSGANLVQNGGFENRHDVDPRDADAAKQLNGSLVRVGATDGMTGENCLVLEQAKALRLPKGWEQAPRLVQILNEDKAGGLAIVTQVVPVEVDHAYDFKFRYKSAGLVREQRDNPKQGYAVFQVFVDWLDSNGKLVSGAAGTYRVMNEQVGSEDDWTQIINHHYTKGRWRSCIAPAGAVSARLRFTLVTMQPRAMPKVWIDDVSFADEEGGSDEVVGVPEAIRLVNAGFEEVNGTAPKNWKATGSATCMVVGDPVRGGAKAVAVSDAGIGAFSGWSTDLSARTNSEYSVAGWIKTGSITPNGEVGGAALCIQFLDKDLQVLGPPVLSDVVPANNEWKQVRTRFAHVPAGATTVRVIAGFQFCKGTVWFDDLGVSLRARRSDLVAHVVRPWPKPSAGVRYATNLLSNGDVESGEGQGPKGWTYVGSGDKNWSNEEIAAFFRESRPGFTLGRGRGSWSRDLVYAGSGALLNTSVDPPLSSNMQFYGRTPVDGYWLSDAMACEPRKAYLTCAWVRPGANIRTAWYGPLQLRFYDDQDKEIQVPVVRPGIVWLPSGEWNYWATLPYIAPQNARSMRLRFGQELSADAGGWGRTYADNVWELPTRASAEKASDHFLRTEQFWSWFRAAHVDVKPPYLPSPTDARQYVNCQGRTENSAIGNLFYDQLTPVKLKVVLSNPLGEDRNVSLQLTRYDWLGNRDEPIEIKDVALGGYSEAVREVKFPASQRLGTYYVEAKIREGDAVVGEFAGRYGVMARPERKQTVENIWAVTTLTSFFGDGRAQETEMGELLKIAGFGLSWINAPPSDYADFSKTMRTVEWYRSFGITPIVRINPLQISRPIDRTHFEALGARIAKTFQGKVAAYGNWGVEQANHRTVKTPVFRPIIDGQMLSDREYDEILAVLYDGIKSVDKQTPVLIGNIATEHDGKAVRRLYEEPGKGRFDGAILNAYSHIIRMGQSVLKEFDQHGDVQKTIWFEELPDQHSPHVGPPRRRGEAEGARNMVRVWLTTKAAFGPRLKAMTFWGFASGHVGGESEIVMVTPSLQPRPHFVAHATLADALADAVFDSDLSSGTKIVYRWKRADGLLFTAWSSDERELVFETTSNHVTVMDLMGNRTQLKAEAGRVTVRTTGSPLYVSGGSDLMVPGKRSVGN